VVEYAITLPIPAITPDVSVTGVGSATASSTASTAVSAAAAVTAAVTINGNHHSCDFAFVSFSPALLGFELSRMLYLALGVLRLASLVTFVLRSNVTLR
jgi:hypothetical protein